MEESVLELMNKQACYGEGIRFVDEMQTEYIDAESGTFNLSLGYNNKYVIEKVQEQLNNISHIASPLSKPYSDEVLSMLLKTCIKNINSGWMRDITGSTANECAIKIAQKYTGAIDVINLFMSHHGQTYFTTGISGNTFRRSGFKGMMSPCSLTVPAPYCYRCHFKAKYPSCDCLCVEAIYDYIRFASSGSVACMILEPILGNGGNIVPPKEYFKRIKKLCIENNIVLIADEVQTGIGRTGYMYASEYFEIEPNIITLAKGLGGIGIPIAAVLMESRLNVLDSYEHSFTSGSNMISLAAAKATIDVISKPEFLRSVRSKGFTLGILLNKLKEKHPCIGDVRGLGLMWGVEIVDEEGNPDIKKTEAIIENAFLQQRLILRGSRYGFGNVIKVRPALIATEEEINEIVEKLSLAILGVK